MRPAKRPGFFYSSERFANADVVLGVVLAHAVVKREADAVFLRNDESNARAGVQDSCPALSICARIAPKRRRGETMRFNLYRPALAGLLILGLGGCSSQPVMPTTIDLNYEGLQTVRSDRFSQGQVRPGVDFTQYEAVYVNEPELDFRTPDRSQQEFPLTDEQKNRFRDTLIASFVEEFTENSSITFVDKTGARVITLDVRVLDIAARIPGRSVGRVGRGGFALDATGSVTFVLEVSDSETGEILARGVETRALQGAATRADGGMTTTWEGVDVLTDRWAEASRTGLEALLEFDGNAPR